MTNGSTEEVESFREFMEEVRLCEEKFYSKHIELGFRSLFFELYWNKVK